MDLRRYNLHVRKKVNGGLVDGLVEGRTGVQVERMENGVVLCCEGNNKEGPGCEDEMFYEGLNSTLQPRFGMS